MKTVKIISPLLLILFITSCGRDEQQMTNMTAHFQKTNEKLHHACKNFPEITKDSILVTNPQPSPVYRRFGDDTSFNMTFLDIRRLTDEHFQWEEDEGYAGYGNNFVRHVVYSPTNVTNETSDITWREVLEAMKYRYVGLIKTHQYIHPERGGDGFGLTFTPGYLRYDLAILDLETEEFIAHFQFETTNDEEVAAGNLIFDLWVNSDSDICDKLSEKMGIKILE